jgi:acyl-CoA synthetase (AMP-forming)/AMP-acid ligase II
VNRPSVDLGDQTVVYKFAEKLDQCPDAIAVHIVGSDGIVDEVSYGSLYSLASQAVRGFQEFGIRKFDRILIGLPSSRETLGVYLGALYAGVIPLMVPQPPPSQRAGLLGTLAERVASETDARAIILTHNSRNDVGSGVAKRIVDVQSLLRCGVAAIKPLCAGAEIAHLQVTSGTTGHPRVAIIRHANINANVRAIGNAIEVRANDRIVSWLPLCHDMGLICVCCALYWQRALILTDASNFVRNPIKYWLQLITDFGGTISAAPTSAYQVCSRLAQKRKFKDLDLSRWRVAFCGSETVYEQTWQDFQTAFASRGFAANAFLPVYGLAEATLAATIRAIGGRPEAENIARSILEKTGRAVPCDQCRDCVTMISVGNPILGHSLRIVSADDRVAPEREVGEIEFAGPSVIDGYWNQATSAELKSPAGYLRTGDMGYLAEGRLFVIGRKKDIIICAGRNLLPHQIELVAASAVKKTPVSGVAAIGLPSIERGTEELHLLLESAAVPFKNPVTIEEQIRSALRETFSVVPAKIHWMRKGQIPKTSNGKIQRYRCKEVVLNMIQKTPFGLTWKRDDKLRVTSVVDPGLGALI